MGVRTARPVSRVFAGAMLVVVSLVFGCDPAAGPPPATPEATVTAGPADAEGCSLERAVAPFADSSVALNCHAASADALCDDVCRDAIRGCVMESYLAGRPFAAAWTNAMVDGVGTRRAIIGRLVPAKGTADGVDSDKRVLEVTWMELTWASGFDVDRATMAKKRVRVVGRRCGDIADVVASCDPRLGAPAPRCASHKLADDAGMFCEPADGTSDAIVCAD